MDPLSLFTEPGPAFYSAPTAPDWRVALVSLLIAYVLAQAVGAVYAWTYQGLSYSKSMVQALVVAGVVAATLMLAMGNSVARGIGIVGTLALVRFRTNLRDPLDMVFIFAAFGAGIAAGTGSWGIAVLGTGMFLLVITLLRTSSFGSYRVYDGVVRLRLPVSHASEEALERALRQLCRRFALITLREVKQGEHLEYAYHIALKDPADEQRLVSVLAGIPGAQGVALSMQEATVEL